MKEKSLKPLISIFLVFLICNSGYSAILQSWNDTRAYYPIPVEFVHGTNSSPEAWGFKIDQRTEEVVGYTKTSEKLLKYFDKYRDLDPRELVRSPYLEPFNYQYNTFDGIEWNAYEGYEKDGIRHPGEQYPDERIKKVAPQVARPVLRVSLEGGDIANVSGAPVNIPGIRDKYKDPLTGELPKTNLVAHSLGGVVSRYYINKTQGANVKQLTTLGTPHKGAAVAKVAEHTLPKSVTEPFKYTILWRVIIIRIFKDLDVNRKPEMIYELDPSSQFIAELNSSIPAIDRYYCIAGRINLTDLFVELHSALALKPGEGLPPLILPANYQPKSILPNYRSRILFPIIHTSLPEKWEEILKAIDSTKPKIEITSPQEGFVWETGATITIEGRVYDEYLPADSSIKIELYKAGYNDYPMFSEIRKPDPVTGYTPLSRVTYGEQMTPIAR